MDPEAVVDVAYAVDGCERLAGPVPAAASVEELVRGLAAEQEEGDDIILRPDRAPEGWHLKCAWELPNLALTAVVAVGVRARMHVWSAEGRVTHLLPRAFYCRTVDAPVLEAWSGREGARVVPFVPGAQDIHVLVGADMCMVRSVEDAHRAYRFREMAVRVTPGVPVHVLVRSLREDHGFADMVGLDADGEAVEAHADQAQLVGKELGVLCGAEHWAWEL